MDALEAIKARYSTRAFLDKAVTHEQIVQILSHASWAPSGVNTQPWKVAVVEGSTKQRITETLIQARASRQEPNPDYSYYPDRWEDPYRMRRIICGKALYKALDISKDDKTRQQQAWNNNYHFFGAPVGLFFFVDKNLNTGSWLDMGMFLQNVMLAATGMGLATCPQASLADYPSLVRDILQIENHYAVVCGMALGYADNDHPVNQYRLDREPVNGFTNWHD